MQLHYLLVVVVMSDRLIDSQSHVIHCRCNICNTTRVVTNYTVSQQNWINTTYAAKYQLK